LTHQLLTFARGGAPIKKTAFMSELIKDSTRFSLKGSRVRVTFSMPDDLWPVEIDEGQMSQVINNLIISADQAMPEGGAILVQAENMDLTEEVTVHGLILPKGKYLKISIKDQGIGIEKEHLHKIFDPYFTTKHTGSGLGLTSSYSIVKNHEGRLTVESELVLGATFHIYLPASPKAPAALKEIPFKEKIEEMPLVGRGKVLIMDDQPMVRQTLGDILVFMGYEVALAENGAEAIEIYLKAQESGRPFDAVIMDLIIPGGMGGEEAVKKLIEFDPETKVIVSSGYSTDPIMADFKQFGFKGCLAKPYDPQILNKTLHKVIRGEA